MAEEQAPRSVWHRMWKWIAGAFTALVAVAGFASPEFRAATCLDLPSQSDLRYAPEPPGAISFATVETESRQQSLDGHDLVFRARYYGETLASTYKPLFGPDKQQGFAYLNLRPLDFAVEDTPLGSTASQLPAALVLVPVDAAAALDGVAPGQVIEVRGRGHWLSAPEPGSQVSKLGIAYPLGDWNDFYVMASAVEVPVAENAPEGRRLCGLFHDLKAQ